MSSWRNASARMRPCSADAWRTILRSLQSMADLGSFQRAFGRALLDGSSTLPFATALAVHRNTVMKGLTDALAANYPTVAQLVGEDWFRACALEYAGRYPAPSPVLALYGEEFPRFLTQFPPAGALAYLAEVARIDRLWVEAHTSADATVLTAASLVGLAPDALAAGRMTIHPAARFATVRHSAATIWIHHRTARANEPLTVAGDDEGILLTRLHGAVLHTKLTCGAVQLLEQVRNGTTLGAAAAAALEADADFDVTGALSRALAAGAFTQFSEMHS
ncbi:MAG TPA: DNA-binding domain-containing protein [Steroidobacteraceae bacterium]|nr:DNA-binding domain-containing protein [Steroidobacteraceae bacterium]